MFVMSCETNFHSFCARIAGAGSEVAAAFGGDPQQAVAALQHIFQIARNQERTVSPGATATAVRLSALQTQAQSRQAEDDTRRLFDEIRAAGLQPPTHSASGLPKPDAQRGYAAVYQTLRAIANRTTLPALAQQVAQAVRVSVPPPSSTLAQAQQTPHVAPRGVLAHVQQANGIVPGSPEFFKPWLGDISTGLSQCRTLREKAMDPVVAARCQQALHEAPSIIGLANGTHAYGGPQFQMEHAALVSLAEHSVATARWFGTIASTFKHKRHMPAQQQQGNVLKLAMVICEAAGIQRCPICGEFMGSSHTCPPTALTDRLTTAVALRAITDAPTLVDLANETHTFRKGGNVDKERSALRTAGYTLGGWERDTLPGIPPALHRLQQQWDRSESAAHAAAFAQALCEAAGLPRCPTCQGYLGDYHLCVPPAPPKLTGTAKKQVLVAASVVARAPSLIDLANGAHTYGTGPDPQAEQAALTGAMQTFARLKTVPAAFRAALERYEADRQVNAPAFAQASAAAFAQELCTLAGVQRCQLCGQFRSPWHLCPNAAPVLPATEIGEQTLVGVASGGTPLTAAQFTKAEHVSIYGQPDPKVTVRGQTVTFNGRYYLPSEWSSARAKRLVPPSLENGLRIGRSLPGAFAVLQGATIVETADGYVQLYDGDCDKLLAVYHPQTNVVGSPGQAPVHVTPDQMAAVLAYRLRHPENALDEALIADYQMLRSGRGSFPAVVDSAELVMTRNVLRATSLVVNAALSVPRCPTCGQWMGDAHSCPMTATPQQRKRKRRLDDAAAALEPNEQVINNQHLAKMYSAIASAIAGAPRRVIFGKPGSGFATDMKGKIFADPQPLGPTAPTAHQLVVIKQGVYHELGHEEFTPGEMWRRLLDLAQAPGPVEVEVDPDLAALPSQATLTTRTVAATDPADAPAVMATLDAGRQMLPKIYNIIEGELLSAEADNFSDNLIQR